jgi:hypothetical protein
MSLRFSHSNEEALVSRVIGLGGLAWIREPTCAVQSLRDQVEVVVA